MYRKNLFIFIIILSGFVMNMISVQIVGSSFKYLQAELNASVEQISYVISASLIAEVIIIPFTGWLCRLMSTKTVFLISLSGFIIASLGCSFSYNFFSMVIFRGLQGFFGGAMLPLMVANIYILFKPREVPIILSIAATVGVSSIALGPILGGYLTENLNWRWMFLYNLPIGIIIFSLAYIFLNLTEKEKGLIKKIDFQGIVFLAVSLISLLIFIEEGQKRDWFDSNFICLCASLSLISIILFINRELVTKYPIIDLKIFLNRNFFIGCICCSVFAITLYVPIFLIPVVLQEIRNIEPIDIGLIIATLGLGMMISGPLVGRILQYFGVRIVVVIGSLITGVGTLLQSSITAEFIFNDFFLSQILKGIGTQFLFMGSQYICFAELPKQKINNAAAMFNLTLRLGAALFIAISSNLYAKWKEAYTKIITQYQNDSIMKDIYEKYIIDLNELDEKDMTINSFILKLHEREASLIAFNKLTFITSWSVLIPVVLMLLVKTNKKNFI